MLNICLYFICFFNFIDFHLNFFDFLLKLGGVLYTLCLFRNGLKKYSREQTWKRNEFVAEQAKVFYTDKMVLNTMYMLDYLPHNRVRNIELFPDHNSYEDRFVKVTLADLKKALLHHTKTTHQFTEVEIAIRDNFDCFFNYFEIFDQYIEAKLITQKELDPYLKYWIAKIDDDKPSAIRAAVLQYINDYKFEGTERFIERFKL